MLSRSYLYLLVTILISASFKTISADFTAPPLQHAKVFTDQQNLEDYWVSEKLDGVRAFWDGKQLITRQGNKINAPDWFTKDFPDGQLDGELWMGRQQFAQLSGAVRKQTPVNHEWQKIRYMVFDKPDSLKIFTLRIKELEDIISDSNSSYLKLVKQTKIVNRETLNARLESVIAQGGEGLMLHKGDSLYQASRTSDILKFKPFEDAEARVVAHISGTGKFTGMMGSLLVEMSDGRQFKIGTGFTLANRKNPPKIGQTITYRFRGITKNGFPRFASYLRIRQDF
ncbi:DNA ligase [Aliikangiella sp. G2MR2-5]|uniref:DNA ligase n=1 Tax=Aliikangiella sp. G2MR2-5 TaxID=2788943 RepID=UPI0018AB7DEE|nr:DNA ligase [Aliikangiella sp. G2MR2-5]